jgi:phosphoserine aminotransferase
MQRETPQTRPGRYSFGAGPTMLPDQVLKWIRDELDDWRGTGLSIMETGQWSERLVAMCDEAEQNLRDLLSVPDGWSALFLHGGASDQFAMVPMNLLRGGGCADYLNTGTWSAKAIREARRYCRVNVVASAERLGFRRVPGQDELRLGPEAAYFHYTPGETAHGLEVPYIPETGAVPLVADCSSTLFTGPIDLSRFGLVYASGHKHLGATGLTVVLVRRDLVGGAGRRTPTTFDYAVHQRTGCRYTTPPVFAWYVAGLMLRWLREQGGLARLSARNRRKADLIYGALDSSGFYTVPVDPPCRSRTSVRFLLPDPRLDDAFVGEAQAAGLSALRGHRSVGGLRASLASGLPEAGVRALVEFLRDFETRYG